MANTKPFTEAHAIAWVDVALFFKPPLSEAQRRNLKKAFAERLVGFKPRVEPHLIAFKKVDVEGDVTEEVHIHSDMVHFLWHEYRGWTFTRDTVVGRVAALDNIPLQQVSGVGLAFRDVFTNDHAKNFELSDVFSRPNRFLPPYAWEAQAKWRASFSWPVETEGSAFRFYSTLFIEASYPKTDGEETATDERQLMEVTHRQWLRPTTSEALGDWRGEGLGENLNQLHRRNKSLMLELLSEGMIKMVGLEET